MTGKRFNEILEQQLARTRQVLAAKAGEYATDADRLHNFKRAAELRGVSPGQALLGMLVKHWISVEDIVDRHAATGYLPGPEVVDEKLGDAICYLILLKAVITEARDDSER